MLSESESEPELLYDWRFAANQFAFAPSPLRPTTNIFSRLDTCGYSPYVTFSLTRGLGLSFKIAYGSRQRIHSQVGVPGGS
jgi:hypothetical protein